MTITACPIKKNCGNNGKQLHKADQDLCGRLMPSCFPKPEVLNLLEYGTTRFLKMTTHTPSMIPALLHANAVLSF